MKVSAIQSYEIQCLDVNLLKEVWQEFETLADALKSNPGSPQYLQPERFKTKALQWATMFRKATFDEVSNVCTMLFAFLTYVLQWGLEEHCFSPAEMHAFIYRLNLIYRYLVVAGSGGV